jgi:hypothetical protein
VGSSLKALTLGKAEVLMALLSKCCHTGSSLKALMLGKAEVSMTLLSKRFHTASSLKALTLGKSGGVSIAPPLQTLSCEIKLESLDAWKVGGINSPASPNAFIQHQA